VVVEVLPAAEVVVVEVSADVPEFPLLPDPVPAVAAVVLVVVDFEPLALLELGVVVVVVVVPVPVPVAGAFPSACCASVICCAMASMSDW
jgi:hypothetical protein